MSKTQFTDTNGKIWNIQITLGNAEDVDKSDFSALTEDKLSILEPTKDLFRSLMFKPRVTFAVIWVLVRNQAQANLGIDPYESTEAESKAQKLFINSMGSTAIEEGRKALIEALSDFFPDRRTALFGLLQQMEKGREAIAKETETILPHLDDYIQDSLTRNRETLIQALKTRDYKTLDNLEKVLDAEDGEKSLS